MKKDNKEEEKQPKKSDFKIFLKKRAPIYLGIIALFIVFVIPELTKGDLHSSFPNNLTDDQKHIVETIMSYNGPNKKGLTVIDAISEQIATEYPNERIYKDKKTKVSLDVSSIENMYEVILTFESHKGIMEYVWDFNPVTQEIKPKNPNAKHIIDLVNYYD